MFYQIEVKDHIRVPPSLFGEQVQDAIVTRIKNAYDGHISKELGIVVDVTEVQDIGEGVVDMVVVGHLLHRKYDPELPASLSKKHVNELLRREIGFDGVVITDGMDMAAVADRFSLVERVTLALNAGVDLLLFCNNLVYDPDRPRQVVQAIIAAVVAGDVTEECLRQHAQRVDRLRDRLSDRSNQPQ